MYKKIIITSLFIMFSFCYSTEESQVLTIKFPELLSNLPKDSTNAAIDLAYKMAEIYAKSLQSSRNLLSQDLKNCSQGFEQTVENVSKIVSSEVRSATEIITKMMSSEFKNTIDGVIYLWAIRGAFISIILQGHDLWKNDNPTGLWFMIFGSIGFCLSKIILNIFENTASYLETNLNEKQLKKLIFNVFKLSTQESINPEIAVLMEELKDEIVYKILHEQKLKAKELVKQQEQPSQFIKNLEKFNKDMSKNLKSKFTQDDISIKLQKPTPIAQEIKSNLNNIINSALDEFDSQNSKPKHDSPFDE